MNIKNTLRIISFLALYLATLSIDGCIYLPSAYKFDGVALGNLQKEATDRSAQILLVTDESFWFFTRRKVYALEKQTGVWQPAFQPVNAVIGKNGFAPPGEKREGDGRTPSGIFSLGLVFGYAETIMSKMPYRQALEDDIWIDDPNAPNYNRWVKKGDTQAASYEKMRRSDDLYKYGIVIEYNTDPVIKGYGSAIFFHVWGGTQTTTEGCVAVSEEDITKILAWLDPAALPLIMMGMENNSGGAPK